MRRRRYPTELSVVAVGPTAVTTATVAIAAARADALGVVDICNLTADAAAETLAQLGHRGNGGDLGVRLDASESIALLPPGLKGVVVAWPADDAVSGLIAQLKGLGQRVFAEVTSLSEAQKALEAGADALIAKGHESGGRVGSSTTLILLQALRAEVSAPVLAQGGVGLHTAGACAALGAAGIVLDSQLLLTCESPLDATARAFLARLDGTETNVVGEVTGESWRLLDSPVLNGLSAIRAEEAVRIPAEWRRLVRSQLGWTTNGTALWPVGQDVALASQLAARFGTVGAIVSAIKDAARGHIEQAAQARPLAPGAPLAVSHATHFPIVQGPMTRVSDQARFAAAVAEGGALPFLALALKSAKEVEQLLAETRTVLNEQPFGVGILGFVPHETRAEQWAAIRHCPPAFALIAGGRPDQALAFETEGIPTYLHVPSPRLLEQFLAAGALRFVFEGRECGGHVGPRTSFVLWDQMTSVLLETVPPETLSKTSVLFAGGIRDARSAAAVAAVAGPLAAAGAGIGVLMGSAYLATREIVATGAVVPEFQAAALACDETALLETGPGHATRCARTPFVETFQDERQRLQVSGVAQDEMRERLERLNLGRLRLAAKGLIRAGETIEAAPTAVQQSDGLYMLGQVATLRTTTTDIAALHEDVSVAATELIKTLVDVRKPSAAAPCNIAIVGMSCLLPGAATTSRYWANIVESVDSIVEVPPDRWPVDRYFNADPAARDGVYSRWGGFLDAVAFDPVEYGMPPNSLKSIEPLQLLMLEAVRAALNDARLSGERLPRDRTSVIIGAGGGVADLGHRYAIRAGLPLVLESVPDTALSSLPEWTEDSFAGILLNVAAGRAANRFDLGGVNYSVDAACASSLAALHLACRELETNSSDVVIAGAGDTVQNPFGYLCFARTHALSPSGRCRTFDAAADGIAISEGIAVVVLKRLDDAERDGDRIYAVIQAVEGSSDGRAKALTAPRPEGQARALRRAYAKAGISPASVGLVEAHGTGTVVGDQAEVETLQSIFDEAGARRRSVALGSVKSMIGHTKCTAGLAGIVKSALALHQQVLPPTLHVSRPNPRAGFDTSAFYVNSRTRPWIKSGEQPRRAAVSAFGFGGTNFHAVLEEYTNGYRTLDRVELAPWPAELFVIDGADDAERLAERLADDGELDLPGLAAALWSRRGDTKSPPIAIVATGRDDLRQKLATAAAAVRRGEPIAAPNGVCWTPAPMVERGSVGFIYPGQGSQSCGMLLDLALRFGEVRNAFERGNRELRTQLEHPLSEFVYPPPTFSEEEAERQEEELRDTRVAQPALAATAVAMTELLTSLAVRPVAVAGHSFGEYAALWAAGVLSESDLYRLAAARGRAIVEAAAGSDLGGMLAVAAARDRVAAAVDGIPDVCIANVNGPAQTVIAGPADALAAAQARLARDEIPARLLPVACAFHSPLVAPAASMLARALDTSRFEEPQLAAYANATAGRYPATPAGVRESLERHLTQPVLWADVVEAMWEDGVRLFVEAGPRNVLSGLVDSILSDRPHVAVAPGAGNGLTGMLSALGRLLSEGVRVDLNRLFEHRQFTEVDVESPLTKPTAPAQTSWLISGGDVRPAAAEAKPTPSASSPAIARPAVSDTLPAAQPSRPERAASGDADGAMVGYQRLMARFLESQQAVMLAYLRGNGGVAGALPPPTQPSTAELPVTERANQPAEGPAVAGRAVDSHAAPTAAPRTDALAALVAMVAERTGYPPDLLDPDAALEADLGIDSIKKVEIIGAMQTGWLPAGTTPTAEQVEALATAKTLRSLAAQLAALVPSTDSRSETPRDPELDTLERPAPPQQAESPAPQRQREQPEQHLSPLPRAVLRERVVAPTEVAASLLQAGTVLIVTDDGGGVAAGLASTLRARAVTVVLAGRSDLESEAAVEAFVARVRRESGDPTGIVHLLPLRPQPHLETLDLATWREAIERDAESFFLLARTTAPLLRTARRPFVAAALGERPVWQAAVRGLLRTLSEEWPEVDIREIDGGSTHSPQQRAAEILDSLDTGRRVEAVAATSEIAASVRPLRDGAVVFVTGGTGAVGSAICLEFARRFHARLVVIGRSPDEDEATSTAGIATLPALRAAVAEHLKAQQAVVTTAEVDEAARRIVGARELRKLRSGVEALGGTLEYIQADVRDERALAGAVDLAYRLHDRIDVAIHAAGVLADGAFESRSLDDFRRVMETKADGAFALARALRPDDLHTLALFGSVAGCFGNAGQSVYSAANSLLSGLAKSINASWPSRVVAINWGPWSGGGMATTAHEQRFRERGVEPIHPAAGAAALIDELEGGSKDDADVIIGAGPWLDRPSIDEQPLVTGPGLRVGQAIRFRRVLDPAEERFLDHHRLDGKPVLPAAFALEMIIEAFAIVHPGETLREIRDFRLFTGIVLDDQTAEIEILVEDEQQGETQITVREAGSEGPAYRALISTAGPADGPAPSPALLGATPLDVDSAYADWLFHGPSLQGIDRAAVALDGIDAVLKPVDDCAWRLDPVVVDSAFQLTILWARSQRDMTTLPAGFRCLRWYRPLVAEQVHCAMRGAAKSEATHLDVSFEFYDEDGTMLATIEGCEFTATRALNRLGGKTSVVA